MEEFGDLYKEGRKQGRKERSDVFMSLLTGKIHNHYFTTFKNEKKKNFYFEFYQKLFSNRMNPALFKKSLF